MVHENICMITSSPTKLISAISQWKTFIRVLPTRWRRKPAGNEITSLSPYAYSLCTCIAQWLAHISINEMTHVLVGHATIGNSRWVGERWYIPVGPKKRPELSHGVTQHSRWNESAEKHVCNEQTSSNMSMNFYLKRFSISRDTTEIVLHVIKQCLQAFYHHRNRFSKKLMVSAGVSWNGKTEFFFHRPSKD